MVLLLLVLVWGVASQGHHSPQDSTRPPLLPTKVVLGQDNDRESQAKEGERAPLLSSRKKILPFLPQALLGSSVGGAGIPGPVGVSLGVGVPIPAPRPLPIPEVVHGSLGPAAAAAAGLLRVPRPDCGGSWTYCPYDHDYPLDKVNSIVDRFYNDVRLIYSDLYRFPTHDLVYFDNATLAYRREGHFVCESSVDYVRPGWAQNLHGQWLAILNTDKFPQTIRVEKCRYEGKRCEYLPPCYRSKCIQRYSYGRLLSVDPHNPTLRPVVDVFRIPSACSCFVQDFTYY